MDEKNLCFRPRLPFHTLGLLGWGGSMDEMGVSMDEMYGDYD